jgi:hypothetical protein
LEEGMRRLIEWRRTHKEYVDKKRKAAGIQ